MIYCNRERNISRRAGFHKETEILNIWIYAEFKVSKSPAGVQNDLNSNSAEPLTE